MNASKKKSQTRIIYVKDLKNIWNILFDVNIKIKFQIEHILNLNFFLQTVIWNPLN